jgi:hypothetical protein
MAPVSLSHAGVNERVWGYLVSGNYFDTLGAKAALGRMISPEDDRAPGAHPVAVLSHKCFERRFGADPSVVGREMIVNGRSFTVIGVAPPGFIGLEVNYAPEIWFPLMMQSEMLMGVVGLVLLLVCTNLANLMLARAMDRRREIAVRLALGAGRIRIVRQLLTENLLLSFLGGAMGLLLASWVIQAAGTFRPPMDVPLSTELSLDVRVFIFTIVITFITSIVFGLLPALQSTKPDLAPALLACYFPARRAIKVDPMVALRHE